MDIPKPLYGRIKCNQSKRVTNSYPLFLAEALPQPSSNQCLPKCRLSTQKELRTRSDTGKGSQDVEEYFPTGRGGSGVGVEARGSEGMLTVLRFLDCKLPLPVTV